jgi:hypothetical protein
VEVCGRSGFYTRILVASPLACFVSKTREQSEDFETCKNVVPPCMNDKM